MRATFLFILVLLANCTSIRPLTDPTLTKENLSEQLDKEEEYWVVRKDGEHYHNLIIDSIEDTYLLGHTKEADILIIPYSSIEKIEKYHFSTAKTIGLVVPVGFLIVAVIVCSTGGCL